MNTDKMVLVCVTPQESSKNLISAGKAIAENKGASLEVVCVLPIKNSYENNSQIMETLYRCVKDVGGEMAIYFSDEPTITVAAHIGKRKPETIVTGFPGENSNDFISTIKLIFPTLPVSMVAKDQTVYNLLPFEANFNKHTDSQKAK